MNEALNGKDIWVRSHLRNGKTSVSFHRVYDVDKFMSSRVKETKEQSPTDIVRAERITQEQYKNG